MSGAPRRTLAAGMLAVFLVALAVGLAGIDVRSTFGGRAAVDEPQYLLSALSLYEDRDLNITDELGARRWKDFHDAELPVQTQPRPDGTQISPHDPLLPLLLAVPMGVGGVVAAKAAMAVLAGLTAALTLWVAAARFAVPVPLGTAVVALAFASPPLGIYSQQVYPEMPAALAVLAAVAAMTGTWTRAPIAAFAVSVMALPWLSVKYAPVAAVLAVIGLIWCVQYAGRRAALTLGASFAAAGVVYLVVHQAIWGGWTVYASGDHFATAGEFAVVGENPDYLGRSERLAGLLLERTWGIAAWQPAWLLIVPAVAVMLVRRPCGFSVLLAPAVTGYLVATFAALTMAGFWSPGRQIVVILPLLVVVIAWWLARCARPVLIGAALLGAAGTTAMASLLIDGWAERITWVSGFPEVNNPLYQGWRFLLPPYRGGVGGAEVWVRHGVWIAVLVAAVGLALTRPTAPSSPTRRRQARALGPGASTEAAAVDPEPGAVDRPASPVAG
ncbi:MAG: hypothetical protein ACT4P1_06395 [Sporichthyaceae bacterium]